MAGLIPAGYISRPGEDIFPTTGPHLDVRVIPQFGKDKGKKINPRNIRSLLQNVLIGENKTPLVQQQGENWNWNFPVTSEYGQRTAPVAGASTFHRGLDIGIAGGTPITYKGYGSYEPGEGFGTISTTDAQGNPYQIRLLHTRGGKKAAVAGPQGQPQMQPQPGIQTQPKVREQDQYKKYAELALFQNVLNQQGQPTIADQLMNELYQGFLG
jgi:hypothetical protein